MGWGAGGTCAHGTGKGAKQPQRPFWFAAAPPAAITAAATACAPPRTPPAGRVRRRRRPAPLTSRPLPAPPHHATRRHCVASPTTASTDCQPATRRGTAKGVARQSLLGRRGKQRRGAPPPRGNRPGQGAAAHRGEEGRVGGKRTGAAQDRGGGGKVDTALGGRERQARRGGSSARRRDVSAATPPVSHRRRRWARPAG